MQSAYRANWEASRHHSAAAAPHRAQRAAVQARAELLHVMGLLAGKWPHTLAIQPGGVTRAPGPREKARLTATLRAFRRAGASGVLSYHALHAARLLGA